MLRYNGKLLTLSTTPDLIPICKQFGGKFNYTSRLWEFPPICSVFDGLQRMIPGLEIHESAEFLKSPTGFPLRHSTPSEQLYPYQQQAVDFLISSPHHGSLLALSPGLGKTFTAIYAAVQINARRILVVAPLTLIPTWQREIEKWTDIKAIVCRGEFFPVQDWNITNYENVVSRDKAFIGFDYDLLILDESIMVKNRKAQRSLVMKTLAQRADHVWLLSGSPVARHADDLYMQLAILEPRYFTSYWRFVNQYCLTEDTIWGTKVVGTRPDMNLRSDFRDFIFSRDQKEVLPELPDLLFETYDCELTTPQRVLYEAMEKDFILELESGTLTASTRLAQLTRLQQLVSCPETFSGLVHSGKRDVLVNMIELEELPLPALIWVNFNHTVDTLMIHLSAAFPNLRIRDMYGQSSESERAEVLSDFQAGKIDILILSLGVGKYGLTLTQANSAVYYDKTFDGDAYVQSLSRIHRIGLDHSPVVYTLHATETTDRLIELNLSGKMQSIHAISNADLGKLLGGLGTEGL